MRYRKFDKIGCALFLFLYALHAFAPGSIYSVADANPVQPESKHSVRDIVWANALYSFFSDDEDLRARSGSHCGCADVHRDAHSCGDMVLVKKKRALYSQKLDITPSFDIQYLSHSNLDPASPFCTADEVTRPLLRETDGYLVLNTGLSPPSFLT